MNVLVGLDLMAFLCFGAALVLVRRLPRETFPRECRVLLAVCLGIQAFVGVSNLLQSTGVTNLIDVYEDSAELLFIPFFVYFVYALGNAQQRRAREQVEQALRHSESLYRSLVDNIDLGITLIDTSHRVVMTNAAQGRLLGRAPSEFPGCDCFRAFENRAEVCAHCPGVRAMETGTPQSEVVERQREDGTDIAVRIHAFPLQDLKGCASGFIEVVEDITEQRHAEANRQRMESRLQQARKLESLGILAGGIAHDFNNLLMAIMGNTELALGRLPPENPARPHLQKALASTERAVQLTGQMLAYAGRAAIARVPSDLSHVVREVLPLLRGSLPPLAALEVNLAQGLPQVPGDPSRLHQVVHNLVTNACEALQDGEGTVRISTGEVFADHAYLSTTFPPQDLPEGVYAFLEVSDDGCGMDPTTLHRLFDPFYSTKLVGRGLGLPAVLGIVRAHRGAIAVTSSPGHGTKLRVLLPIDARDPAARDEDGGRQAALPRPPPAAAPSSVA